MDKPTATSSPTFFGYRCAFDTYLCGPKITILVDRGTVTKWISFDPTPRGREHEQYCTVSLRVLNSRLSGADSEVERQATWSMCKPGDRALDFCDGFGSRIVPWPHDSVDRHIEDWELPCFLEYFPKYWRKMQ
jgi:hypothetical protein